MDGITTTLVGDKELIAALDRLEKRDAAKAIRRGLRAGAKIITKEAKALAPVRTRALKKAIRTRAGKRSRRYIAVVTTIGEGTFKGETFYGGFQEWGWHAGKRQGYSASYKARARAARVRGQALGGRRYIEGHYFMEEAGRSKGHQAGDVALQVIGQEIEKAMQYKVGSAYVGMFEL